MAFDVSKVAGIPPSIEMVDVPEWAGDPEHVGPAPEGVLYVRTLRSAQQDDFESKTPDGDNRTSNYRARYSAYALCESDGSPVFLDAEVGAVQLGMGDGRVVKRLFDAARKVNGHGDAAADEAEKNSESGQTSSSQ